ncbi:DUF4911 domain-containing protein [Geobacter sp. DSM 9736]|uniref:DUF4911 domain-containing protein n=1 Tax=Geobacter sp. DSM 9736 TaxID=1277350 RepID=UPI000B512175|nr:DUF4911 domain-containing protein [Geobacter sp. DSM 9736]SNB48106.1 protein of unknown function [Geobacter sp. DSM 9736]
MQCTSVRHFRIMRRELIYLKFIMEAYEGLATLSTADKLNGIVRISYDPAFAPDVEDLLSALQQETGMVEVVADPSTFSQWSPGHA